MKQHILQYRQCKLTKVATHNNDSNCASPATAAQADNSKILHRTTPSPVLPPKNNTSDTHPTDRGICFHTIGSLGQIAPSNFAQGGRITGYYVASCSEIWRQTFSRTYTNDVTNEGPSTLFEHSTYCLRSVYAKVRVCRTVEMAANKMKAKIPDVRALQAPRTRPACGVTIVARTARRAIPYVSYVQYISNECVNVRECVQTAVGSKNE